MSDLDLMKSTVLIICPKCVRVSSVFDGCWLFAWRNCMRTQLSAFFISFRFFNGCGKMRNNKIHISFQRTEHTRGQFSFRFARNLFCIWIEICFAIVQTVPITADQYFLLVRCENTTSVYERVSKATIAEWDARHFPLKNMQNDRRTWIFVMKRLNQVCAFSRTCTEKSRRLNEEEPKKNLFRTKHNKFRMHTIAAKYFIFYRAFPSCSWFS